MSVPTFQQFMRPVLEAVSDGKTYSMREIAEKTAAILGLNEAQKAERTKTGVPLYYDRLKWAKTYFRFAGALQILRRNECQITDLGRKLLAENQEINLQTLKQFESFMSFKYGRKSTRSEESDQSLPEQTPEDSLEETLNENYATVKAELLEQLREIDPFRFETLCCDLLLKLGYGGSREEFAEITKKSGDGGIDGVIRQDALGFGKIYIQAKRWQNNIQEKEVRDFLGALEAAQADNAVFITTSGFSEKAKESAARSRNHRVVLIDGDALADLMIRYRLGVQIKQTVELLKIDQDYFSGDDV
ncbi:MAG: restriction endonuclease [Helicobacteraceae bacterium]|jgi:restriction system protein|nr:restriction endonuclease [Helicobacteraceae bacterium]